MDINSINMFLTICTFYVLPALIVGIRFFRHFKKKHGYITYGDVIGVSIIAVIPGVNISGAVVLIVDAIVSSEENVIKKFLDKKAF